jgi:hypothetical protein
MTGVERELLELVLWSMGGDGSLSHENAERAKALREQIQLERVPLDLLEGALAKAREYERARSQWREAIALIGKQSGGLQLTGFTSAIDDLERLIAKKKSEP